MGIIAVLFTLFLVCGFFGGPIIRLYIGSCLARIFFVLFALCMLFLLIGFLVLDAFPHQ